MASSVIGVKVSYDEVADVLYLTLRRCEDSLGEQNDEGIVVFHDAQTGEVMGLLILDFWARFVHDGKVDEDALARVLDAPFTGFIPDMRDAVLPA